MNSCVDLLRVDEADRPALYRLVDEYLLELATHREHPIGPVDAATYEYLPMYWTEAGRHPFFLRCEGDVIGFALLREVREEEVIQMSDFYICPQARREGAGSASIERLWRDYPGLWELQVHVLNEAAMRFWPQCIQRWSTGKVISEAVSEDDGRRIQYNFEIALE